MKLLYQTHSPYARKALVFAHEAGLAVLASQPGSMHSTQLSGDTKDK